MEHNRGLAVASEVSDSGALRGAGEEMASVSSISCVDASTESPPQDAVLVNIRPVGLVSLLLTPG